MISIKETGIFDEDRLKESVESGLRHMYPLQSQNRTLEIDNIKFGKPALDPNDYMISILQ